MCVGTIKELGKTVMYILCFTCLTGPALIIAGSLFFSSASVPTRENAVQQYTDAVNAWSSSVATGAFSTSQFSVTTSVGTTSLVKTTSDGTEESWLKSREPTVPIASNHYRYEASVTSLQSSTLAYPAASGSVATVNLAPQLVEVNKTVTYDSGNLNCRTGSCNQADSAARQSCQNKPLCTDACTNRNGVWDSSANICRANIFLSSVCMMYNPDTQQPDQTRGCYYESRNSVGGVGANSIGQYTSTQPARVRVQIRHPSDPIILASSLTQGSYDFGLTVGQKRTMGTALLVSGFVFIGIVGCCIWACVACRRGRLQGGKDAKVVPMTTASSGGQVQSTAAVPAPYNGYPAGGSYPMQTAPQPYAPSPQQYPSPPQTYHSSPQPYSSSPQPGYQQGPPQYSPTQPAAYGSPYGVQPTQYGQAPHGAYPPPQGVYAASPSAPPPQGYYQQAPTPYGYPPQQPAPGGYPAAYEYPK